MYMQKKQSYIKDGPELGNEHRENCTLSNSTPFGDFWGLR